ncbi:DNA polymerase I [bacterium]|nr:MAG: DNA polymerase I [bacterium]
MPNPALYLIDATGLCYRAYYALPALYSSLGQPTGAVFGFINILNKILKENPEYLACCFDVSRETFRQKKYKEYKIHRPAMPDELSSQMNLIGEAVSSYNVLAFELEGYEADDLIATLAKKAREKFLEVVVVSSDKDMLQLVDDKVKVFDPKKDKSGLLFDKAQVKERFGIEPAQIVDYFSLTGDSADNIPGVKGIGDKTARALLSEFGSVENLIAHPEKIGSNALRESILSHRDQINLNRDLLKLNDGLDLDFDLSVLRRKEPDYDKLYSLFTKLEFKSLLKKLKAPDTETAPAAPVLEPLENNASMKEKVFDSIRRDKELLFILDDMDKEKLYILSNGAAYSLGAGDEDLRAALQLADIRKISHNLKDALIAFLPRGIHLSGQSFDTMLAAYCLEASAAEFSLSELAYRYLRERHPEERLVPADKLRLIIRLAAILQEKLKEGSQEKLFYELEMPLAEVLASMQLHGVKINAQALGELSRELEKRLIGLRSSIYASSPEGGEFNLNSPRQLAEVLFERLKLPVVKKTKTGFSTDEEVLRKLSREHPLPGLLLEYRGISKLKSTYVDSLPSLIDSSTGRIHAVFNQVGTETGRLSSHNPNLQNIPVKGDIACLIRKSFIAEAGHYLLSADYSQIELRILAHFSGDSALISAFKNDRDIHRHSAGLIFQVDEGAVTDQMRETAKRINFGIVYGMGYFGLSKDLGISVDEARKFIEDYFLRYPQVKRYIDRQILSARESGYTQTLLGRRRQLAGINSTNNSLRSFAERQAVNSPIQGSAADLIKLAMINIYRILRARRLQSRITMQIHDELVFEVPENELREMIPIVREAMESVYALDVPIKVNIKKGSNWLEMDPA